MAAALIAQLVSASGLSLRELADQLPRFSMIKSKLPLSDESWGATAARLTSAFAGMSLDEVDGLRFSAEREWVHVRASGTEPVVRVIAESPDERRTRTLIERASDALRGVHPRGKA